MDWGLLKQVHFTFRIFMSRNKLHLKSFLNLKGNTNFMVEEYGNSTLSNFYHKIQKVVYSNKINCNIHNILSFYLILKSLYTLYNVQFYWEIQIIRNLKDQDFCTAIFIILVNIFILFFFIIHTFINLITFISINFLSLHFIQ
jgi:hypothetical protein